MSSIRFRTRRLVAGSWPPITRVPVAEYAAGVMYATDGETSRQVPPVDLACAEDRPLWVKRSLLSPANVNPSVVMAQPRPRFRRIGQWWPQGACSPAAVIRA